MPLRGDRDGAGGDLSAAPPRAVADLHCHLLPGIDDGARDLGDSVEMARESAADGIEVVCATPHIRHDHDVRIAELPERVAEVQAELDRRGIAVRVASGGEVAETALAALDDSELASVALAEGSWVLLEPRPGPLSDSLSEAVEHLSERGFGALIAHPERHFGPDLAERLSALASRGALVQATADHLVRAETAPSMLALAERGLIHVLGSDSHSSRAGRSPRLRPALERLQTVKGLAAHIAWMAEVAPRAVLAGEPLRPPF